MNTPKRTGIFDDHEAGNTIVPLAPTPKKSPSPEERKALDEAAALNNFVSREPSKVTQEAAPPLSGKRPGKGPKVQLNLRVDEGLKARFQAIVDEREVRHETIFRMALEALEREISAKAGQ
ncbi:hypothetical protein [Novosphingobium sp. HII-3]|uniref:hypothetical protein n=1 Tax=Novosphingobium sp. HII-3 TaxID=2075565 RepID=UPI000CDA64FD|nr:hypothetical protein [Novosphingobium sp. HII-3]